jgi:hypothetical protein
MEYSQVKVRGILGQNKYKKTEKQPDMRGRVDLTQEIIHEAYSMIQQGKTPELNIAGWYRTSERTGEQFVSLSCDVGEAKERQSAPPQPKQEWGKSPWEG